MLPIKKTEDDRRALIPPRKLERKPNIPDHAIKSALTNRWGDLALVSLDLQMTVKALTVKIQGNIKLRDHYMLVCRARKENPDFLQMTQDQFQATVELTRNAYVIDALEGLHELATIPVELNNPKLMQVKKEACEILTRLDPANRPVQGALTVIFQKLRDEYEQSAPHVDDMRSKLESLKGDSVRLPDPVETVPVEAEHQ